MQNAFDFANGLHGFGAGAGALKLHQQHGGAGFIVKEILHILGQHLAGNFHRKHIAGPHHLAHTGHGGQLVFHFECFGGGHIFHRDHGRAGHVKIILQIAFADHRVQLGRKIGKDIVVDISGHCAEQRGDQQQHCDQQHQPPAANNKPGKMFHAGVSFRKSEGYIND